MAQVSFAEIEQASEDLHGIANRTPVFTSRTLDRMVGASVFLKCENFQRSGSFKFRGAYHAMSTLPREEQSRGVLTYSSGNHAQAIALAGSLLGIPTLIVMPDDAPAVKVAATRAYGAEIILYDKTTVTREELGAHFSRERGLPVIPPYDHPMVVAGQGTAARELIEEVGHLDLVMTPCGGGGLLSGSAISTKHLLAQCAVVGVEPELADDATRSFYSRTLQTVHNPDTIADGARTPYLGKITFPLVLEYVDHMVTVSEEEIIQAVRFLWERLKLVVEPTGALPVAALLSGKIKPDFRRIGVILSGGNADISFVAGLLDRPG